MTKYEKPLVAVNSDLAEGVYAASGGSSNSSSGKYQCGSQYTGGVFHNPTYNPINDGYLVGRGCEGCPAWNGTSCRFESAPQEMENWSGNNDFRPTWEVQGHLPDEKGY